MPATLLLFGILAFDSSSGRVAHLYSNNSIEQCATALINL